MTLRPSCIDVVERPVKYGADDCKSSIIINKKQKKNN